MGTTLSWNAGHACILDARFLKQACQLLAETLIVSFQSHAGIPAIGGPAASGDEGEVGQGNHLNDRGSDAASLSAEEWCDTAQLPA